MGLGAWLRSLGGCCGCCGGEAAAPEKEPLLSNNNPYASFGATLARDEEQNLWSTPHDVTHTEADDDRVLYNMIVVRNQLDKDSEEWQKLNYDIYTLRQTRKEVRSRWKHILEDLGFQKEADSLLSVTKLSIISDSQNMGKARDILLKLSEETNIFPTSWELSERYLFVVESDRGAMGARSPAGCFTCPAGSQRQPPSQQFPSTTGLVFQPAPEHPKVIKKSRSRAGNDPYQPACQEPRLVPLIAVSFLYPPVNHQPVRVKTAFLHPAVPVSAADSLSKQFRFMP